MLFIAIDGVYGCLCVCVFLSVCFLFGLCVLKCCRSGIYLHCWHSAEHTKRIKKPIYSNDKEKQWAHDETPHVLVLFFFFLLMHIHIYAVFNEIPLPLRWNNRMKSYLKSLPCKTRQDLARLLLTDMSEWAKRAEMYDISIYIWRMFEQMPHNVIRYERNELSTSHFGQPLFAFITTTQKGKENGKDF